LDPHEKESTHKTVVFRKGSQDVAINMTKKAISSGKQKFLWDAKMRFGKTLASLQIAKELNYKRTLIVTHRPVVSEDWYKDFEKIFYSTNFKFGSVSKGYNLDELLSKDDPFVYFASLQI
jgi:superfamily II DNA or RNA helicase